jgi:hypothetical protein
VHSLGTSESSASFCVLKRVRPALAVVTQLAAVVVLRAVAVVATGVAKLAWEQQRRHAVCAQLDSPDETVKARYSTVKQVHKAV